MNIEKLPSGSYRVRKMVDGKRHTMIFDHKPTEKEILLALSDKVEKVMEGEHIPFELAAKEYCKLKKNVISPTTFREYTNTASRLSDRFTSLYIDQITQIDVQQEINELSATRKPKTVKNYHAFISAVLSMYRPNMVLHTTLPKGVKAEKHIPSDEEARLLVEYAKTHCCGRYYVPLVLSCYGMRRSEICALLPSDIEDNVAHITKAKVMDVNKEWVIKAMPKTETSIRDVPIPSDVVNIINDQGYVFDGVPGSISDFIADACKDLKIEHISIHSLRHYFCSRLSAENIDTETILSLGGWKTEYVMKNIYRHKVDSKVKEASEKLSQILF